MERVVTAPVNIELFPCSGGMAEGFLRAGVTFDFAFEYEEDHCASYEANLGHRPVRMDVRELLAMIRGGWRVKVGLMVTDPPCTPWSRSGKREGIADERDMLVDTCEIIRLLRPETYLIGNVPGLDDSVNWHIVQKVIGSLEKEGYCVADFAALDAADYGVPQHRIRPFWFGHQAGPCLRFPAPTHGDPKLLHNLVLPGITPLIPWVTCKQALGHLEGDELGRPVRLRKRGQNSDQHGSVPERPARVVGTSNLSDGNVILTSRPVKNPDGSIIVSDRHMPATEDHPAPHIGAKYRGQGAQVLVLKPEIAPATARRKKPRVQQNARAMPEDQPATVVHAKPNRQGSGSPVLVVDMHHPPSYSDEPAKIVRAGDGQGSNRALVLDGSAPTRRRGTGSSTQGMQSSRVRDADRPSSVVTCDTERATGNNVKLRVTEEWPWPRPSTTIQRDERIPPPGHHDEDYATRSMEGAVILSERAAAILQGFTDGECTGHLDDTGKYTMDGILPGNTCGVCGHVRRWNFMGTSKKVRWNQIGQAMPPGLAHPVATAVVEQIAKTPAMAPAGIYGQRVCTRCLESLANCGCLGGPRS
jgi:site-specific DNA-cytosine methylase